MRKRIAVASTVALLASASPAVAQQETVVFTNVIDGQRVAGVVRVLRVVGPAAPVPPSIVTTPTFDRRQFIDDLLRREAPSRYVPPPAPATASARPTREPEPWFYNGMYMGPSPSGQWMSVAAGPPIVEVRLAGPLNVRLVQPAVQPADANRSAATSGAVTSSVSSVARGTPSRRPR